MHDKHGTPLNDGDTVILTGTFKGIGEGTSGFCNGQVDIPQLPGTEMTATAVINSRHCEKVNVPLSKTVDELADRLYTRYCESVGGTAFNGDPLPSWSEFVSDPLKQKQASAWRDVARFAAADLLGKALTVQ